MCRKLIYLFSFVLVLGLCLMSSAYAVDIIWVTEAHDYDRDGIQDDQQFVDWLVAEGHSVDIQHDNWSTLNADWTTLNADKIEALNAADLIIVGRTCNSTLYDEGDEPTQWNSVTTPLILLQALITRSNRWKWVNSSSANSLGGSPALQVMEPDHPIFANVTLGAGNQVQVVDPAIGSGHTSSVNANNVGNGTLLAKQTGTTLPWIAEWEAGVEFYNGAGQIPAAKRMMFFAGTQETDGPPRTPWGAWNLTAEGEIMFRNAINYMLGDYLLPGQASNPKPDDEATDVPRDVVLGWTPGEFAPPINGHKVYISENFNDVNDGIGGVAQDASSYSPGRLAFGTTYYWRVDEVNAPPDSTIFEGAVWSFTTELYAYPIENITATASSTHQANMGPENTINGSGVDVNDLHSKEPTDMWLSGNEPLGAWIEFQFDKVYKLHQMWIWNSNQMVESLVGFGFKGVTIEHSTNGTDYSILADVLEFAQAPGADGYAHNTTVDLGSAAAKYIRLTANSNWGGIMPQYGLSEVRSLYVPIRAREPYPDSGATDVDVDVTLGWRAGREAAKHDVYFSTDQQAVIDGTAGATTVTETSHGPLSLDLGKTYYWKTNEVNMAETPTTLDGDLWNFTTRQFLIVDDFETYNDLDPTDPNSNRIFNVWIDGYGDPNNGSLVGYDAGPFVEQTIVHSGEQSMPFFYSNTGGAAYSEAERTFVAPQNWTEAGTQILVLYFYGADGNSGQLYVKVDGSKVVYGGDAGDIAKVEWKQWSIDLASLGAGVQNVTKLGIGIDGNGATGTLYFDDIRLYPSAP
jgi:hypothetical protein